MLAIAVFCIVNAMYVSYLCLLFVFLLIASIFIFFNLSHQKVTKNFAMSPKTPTFMPSQTEILTLWQQSRYRYQENTSYRINTFHIVNGIWTY